VVSFILKIVRCTVQGERAYSEINIIKGEVTVRIGIVSQVCSQEDMEIFKRAAEKRDIELIILNPSTLIISVRNDCTALLDMNLEPANLSGIINWEPYPAFEELEQACISLGIPFVNSVDAVRTARNKMLTSLILARHKLPQPDTFYLNYAGLSKTGFDRYDMPLVLKPKTGTQGRGAVKINSSRELGHLVYMIVRILKGNFENG
jgi:glutathione synthase/RimK-type ligase-like ATP-grasp enzyme